GETVLPGADAFRLYDTFGFPLDLTEETAREHGLEVDRSGFERELAAQRERARAARQTAEGMNADRGVLETLTVESRFVGYTQLQAAAHVTALVRGNAPVEQLAAGEEGEVLLDVTPFYAESGGQLGDRGSLQSPGAEVEVLDVKKAPHGQPLHRVRVHRGVLRRGDEVQAQVSSAWRRDIVKNHTATHLLHKALREVLGQHVAQAGSLVADQRLRFDFSHFGPLTAEELAAVEQRVNDAIWRDEPVEIFETDLDQAKAMGAMALFGEKYGQRVRVVKAGDYSIELCGGCHVERTGVIGLFQIVSETGIGAGVRRIEAVTGRWAYAHVRAREALLQQVAQVLKAPAGEVLARAERTVEELRQLERELEAAKARLQRSLAADLASRAEQVCGVPVVTAVVPGQDADGLRRTIDELRPLLPSHVIVLGSSEGDRVVLVAAVSKDLQARKLHAGQLVKQVAQVAGGSGGGRPDLA
ncbi:MAG: alanine--tRNA ligase, partial [Alicyclobacillus sp.]|nr:alanine--tRNA ligase [Alicyclobacillus sp.]